MSTFTLPDLGEGLTDAEIVAWHVSPGDHVAADQPLVSVETAKAVVEIPSPQSGTIAELHGAVGEVVPVGAPLVVFADAAPADKGAIVGALETAPPAPKAARGSEGATVTPLVRAAPAARALARERGVDLAAVAGTGPGGAVTRADVEAAAGGAAAEAHETAFEPLRGPRRVMAQAMARFRDETAPATLTDFADVTAWWGAAAEATLRLCRALCRAAEAEPALNAWFDGARSARRLHRLVNIGVAVDAPEGLFAPVLKGAEAMDAETLRASLAMLIEGARARRLSPQQMLGATVTLSNFGGLGGRFGALAVTPPQVAILGAGRVETALRLANGQVEERLNLPLSLTFDHRACTGGEAARFLAAAKADLERPD